MITKLLKQHLNQCGDQAALVDFDLGPISWCQFGEMIVVAIGHLDSLDRTRPIAHTCRNGAADVVVAVAAAITGAIEAPLDHRLDDNQIRGRVDRLQAIEIDSATKDSFVSQVLGDNTATVLPARRNQAIADQLDVGRRTDGRFILWTSGTTTQPRPVELSHQAWIANARAKEVAVQQTPDDVRLTVLPLSHAYARTCDLGTWLVAGGTLAVTLGRKGLQKWAPKIRPTLINCVPAIADACWHTDLASVGLDRLRILGVGGAPLSEESFKRWKASGVTVIQGYGQTESGPVICSATPDNAAPGLVGDLVEGWEYRVDHGQLYVRGEHVMRGYWKDPEATRDKIDSDGWLRTGDLVQRDIDRQQWRILGRADDVIVLASGNKLHPSAIEREVGQIDGVEHAILVNRGAGNQDVLELWMDGTRESSNEVRRVLDRFTSYLSIRIQFFDTPLSFQSGELTAKGTIRRHQLVANRFS